MLKKILIFIKIEVGKLLVLVQEIILKCYSIFIEVIKYENVISSELGSAVFYALYLKKKVKVMFEVNGNNINGNKNNYIKMIF